MKSFYYILYAVFVAIIVSCSNNGKTEIVNVSEESFDAEVISSSVPVLVEFWATWCAPCKIQAPILEALNEHYNGRVKIVKVDVDQNNALATRYRVRAIPTLIVVNDGKKVEELVGVRQKNDLIGVLDRYK